MFFELKLTEFLSSFAISIATSIITGKFKLGDKTIEDEINATFLRAIGKHCPNIEIRESYSYQTKIREIKEQLLPYIDYENDKILKKKLGKEAISFVKLWEKEIASSTKAYNYLKEIRDFKRYYELKGELTAIKRIAEDNNRQIKTLQTRSFLTPEQFKRQQFQEDFCINEKIEFIITQLKEKNGINIRFLALSGMGKSRIIYEAFKDECEKNFYYAEYYSDDILKTIPYILNENENSQGVIIVDDCEYAKHNVLQDMIKRHSSSWKLITLNNVLDDRTIYGCNLLKVDSQEFNSIVSEIADKSIKGENRDIAIDKIREISSGIPYMAILLCEAYSRSQDLNITYDQLLDRLLNGSQSNSTTVFEQRVLKAISLFQPLGYKGPVEGQFKFLALSKDLIPEDYEESSLRIRECRFAVEKFKKRQLIEEFTPWINVRPLPLAIWLMNKWFEESDTEQLLNLITDLERHPESKLMFKSLSQRIRYLEKTSDGIQTVENLLREKGPFDNAKVLASETGSLLFRTFSEVSPVLTSQILYRHLFERMDEMAIRNIQQDARRNLVWGLEKLCFDHRTFDASAKILFRLSMNETEEISNNATGIFLQLFHIALPGTEADLLNRFLLFKYCYETIISTATISNKFLLRMFSSAFDGQHFYRSGGAETRGMTELKDYSPTYREINEYWSSVTQLFLEFANTHPSDLLEACKVVSKNTRSFIRMGSFSVLETQIEGILPLVDWNNTEMLGTLHMSLKYDKPYLTDENSATIIRWTDKLTKKDFCSRLSYVQKNWGRNEVDWKEEIEQRNIVYADLAKEFALNEWNNRSVYEFIYNSEYSLYHVFAHFVYQEEQNDFNKISTFVKISLDIILGRDVDYSPSYSFFIQFCKCMEDQNLLASIYSALKEMAAYKLLFAIAGTRNLELSDVGISLKNMDEDKISAENWTYYIDNRGFESKNEVFQLFDKISSLNDQCIEILLPYLSMEAYDNNSLSDPVFLKVSQNATLRLSFSNDNRELISLAEKLVDASNAEYALAINRKILNYLKTNNSYGLFDSIFFILIKNYKSEIWDDLSEALLADGKDFAQYYHLRGILGAGSSMGRGLLFEYGDDFLFDWCSKNLPEAPVRLAAMMPVFCYGENNNEHKRDLPTFSDFAIRIINTYGDNEDVLDSFHANMNTFSWTGSIIPLYQDMKHALEKLLSHKFNSVVLWAKNSIESLDEQIARETLKEGYEQLHYK